MSILNVNTIQPVGSGQTITVSATNISAPSTVVTASSFVGNVTATTISGVSTAGITTAYIGSINNGPISGARNRIINGSMSIDQRNAGASTSVTTGNVGYTVDRWGLYSLGATQSAQRVSTNITGLGVTFQYGLQVTGATSATQATFYQRIESVNIADLAGQTVTLSFVVYNSESAKNLNLGFFYPGSTDNYASPTGFGGIVISIPNGWSIQTYTLTLNSNCVNGVAVEFQFGAVANGATRILTGVQLEPGTVATPFERRSYGQELALCQRYLPAINGASVIGAGFCGSTTQGFIEVIHFVTPRVAPTGITISAANTFTIYGNSAASVTPTSITLNAGGTQGSRLTVNTASGLTNGSGTGLYANSVNSQLLFTGCEL